MSDAPTPDPPPGKRTRRDLVALGTAAVLTVYGAGYLRTQEAARLLEEDDLGRAPTPASALAPPPGGSAPADSGPATEAASGLTAEAAGGAGADAAADAVAGFRDGLYTGMGRSRHGNIVATLEIRDGRIVSATISDCRTLYPCSRIEEIVPQVVERQDSWVDNVSGATVSVTAFYRAVVKALEQAQ